MELLEAIKLFNRFHKINHRIYERSCVGCCCHITLDDCNYERHYVEFCLRNAEENQCDDCKAMCELLLSLPDDATRKELICPDYVEYGDDE